MIIYLDREEKYIFFREKLSSFKRILFEEKKEKKPLKVTLKKISPLSIEVGLELIPMIDPSLKPNPLLDKIFRFRRSVEERFLFSVPGIIFKDNLRLKPFEYIIRLRTSMAGKGEVLRNHFLLMGNKEKIEAFQGRKYSPDYIYYLEGVWIEKNNNSFDRKAFFVMEDMDVIYRHIEYVIYNNLHKIFTFQDTEQLLDRFINKYSKEILALRAALTISQICRIFRNLLRDHIPLVYTGFIFENLYSLSCKGKSVDEIYENLRTKILPFIVPMCIYTDPNLIDVFAVNSSLEDLLLRFSRKTKAGYELDLPFSKREAFFNAFSALLRNPDRKKNTILICNKKVRPLLSIALRENFPETGVFSSEELPMGFTLNIKGEFNL